MLLHEPLTCHRTEEEQGVKPQSQDRPLAARAHVVTPTPAVTHGPLLPLDYLPPVRFWLFALSTRVSEFIREDEAVQQRSPGPAVWTGGT